MSDQRVHTRTLRADSPRNHGRCQRPAVAPIPVGQGELPSGAAPASSTRGASGGNHGRTEFGSRCCLRARPPLHATRIRRYRQSRLRRPVERARHRSQMASESQPSPPSKKCSPTPYVRLRAARGQSPGFRSRGSEACRTVSFPSHIQPQQLCRGSSRRGQGLERGGSSWELWLSFLFATTGLRRLSGSCRTGSAEFDNDQDEISSRRY